MSKFLELCNSYNKAQNEFKDYRKDCFDFTAELWERLMTYFDVPKHLRVMYKIDEKGELDMVPPKVGNAMVMSEEMYYLIGFGITLRQEIENEPNETIQIPLLIKKAGDHFYVRLTEEENDHEIDPTKEKDFIAFFDFLFETIISMYGGLQEFDDENETVKRIGFSFDKEK